MNNQSCCITEFLSIVEKLGSIRRDIKNLDGYLESDSAHIAKLCCFTQLVAPYLQTPVDSLKMLELALVHDLVEAECGDIPLCAQKGDANLKELKKQNELAAILRYKEMLPPASGNKIYELFMEYENKTSREAEVVYVLDKLEASFSACRYGDGDIRYWGEGKNGDWYYHTAMNGDTPEKKMLAKLQEPFLNQLETMALANCRRAIKKSGIVLQGEFPKLHYIPDDKTTAIILAMDEIEKANSAPSGHIHADTIPGTKADEIIMLCYQTLLNEKLEGDWDDYSMRLNKILWQEVNC